MDRQKSLNISQRLWGSQAQLFHLILVAAILMFFMLGARELWTQEGRWADICWSMLVRRDYWHPYLDGFTYFDKPLLSYWSALSLTWLTGLFNEWSLRFPSAVAGLVSVWCVYRIGKRSGNPQIGLVAGWLFVTTFFVIFWSRVISADMLNVAGFLLAITWYFECRRQASVWRYSVFFMILAVASLMKGPVAAVVTTLAILPDLFMAGRWREHLNIRIVIGLLVGLALYFLPFFVSSLHTGGANGLAEVYRENLLRYFQPFDHKEAFYVYFYYLPLYLLPWTFFFIPALFQVVTRWSTLTDGARWAFFSTILVFAFMVFSGSRRNYYTLMMLPFAILFTAHWIVSDGPQTLRCKIAGWTCVTFVAIYFLTFALVMPYFSHKGPMHQLAAKTRHAATHIAPWEKWHVVMVHTSNKMGFYLKSAHPSVGIHPQAFAQNFPAFLKKHPHTIVITRAQSLKHVAPGLKGFIALREPEAKLDKLLGHHGRNDTWVFVPKMIG